MNINFRFVGWSALILIGAARADIYTCRHPDGTTELTDAPCARSATTVNVLRRPTFQHKQFKWHSCFRRGVVETKAVPCDVGAVVVGITSSDVLDMEVSRKVLERSKLLSQKFAQFRTKDTVYDCYFQGEIVSQQMVPCNETPIRDDVIDASARKIDKVPATISLAGATPLNPTGRPVTSSQLNRRNGANPSLNSGTEAGYRWAMEKRLTRESQCAGNSESFINGCVRWVRELTELDESEEPQSDYRASGRRK